MAGSVRVLPADPQGAEALALLREAAVEARQLYPELFKHDAPWPTNPPVGERGAFLLAYVGDELAGCGALRMMDATTAEVRRMFVRASARRVGVARAVLAHLEIEARALGYNVLRLETGVRQQAAMALYERAGFKRIPPFGEYAGDPTSVCFEKRIGAA
jgi:putative acetyltransferase